MLLLQQETNIKIVSKAYYIQPLASQNASVQKTLKGQSYT